MTLLSSRKVGFILVALYVGVLSCLTVWHSQQILSDSSSSNKIASQIGTTPTIAHAVDPTNTSTLLAPPAGKGLSISESNIVTTHAADRINERMPTTASPGKSFSLSENERVPTTSSPGKSFSLSENKSVAMDWWEPYVDAISQPFRLWNGTKWCYDEEAGSLKSSTEWRRVNHGLMLTKVFKAASSTAAAVTLSVAHRVAKRLGHAQPCLSYPDHSLSMRNAHSHRNTSTSFLWATVREPHLRANSAFFYFEKSKDRERQLGYINTTLGNQLRQIRRRKDYPIHFEMRIFDNGRFNRGKRFGLEDSIVTQDPHKLAFEHIQEQVLQWYDFIAVVERWEESMVVMKLLLNEDLEYADLVVLKAKGSGSWSHPKLDRSECLYVPKSTTSPDIEEYLQTTYRQNNPDYLLYAAVNRSLDLTIDLLGRQLVEDGVRQFRKLQALAQEKCLANAIFPCHANGTFQPGFEEDCYGEDWGCGHRCVDKVLDEYHKS